MLFLYARTNVHARPIIRIPHCLPLNRRCLQVLAVDVIVKCVLDFVVLDGLDGVTQIVVTTQVVDQSLLQVLP